MARQPPGTRSVVSDHVPGAVCAGLPVGPIQSSGLVLPKSGEGSIETPAPHPRSGPCPASVWLSAYLGVAAVRRLASESERVRRLYRLDGLQLHMRVRRRKHIALHRGPAPMPDGPMERWSMDSVHDTLADGPPFRIFMVVDSWSRQCPVLEVAFWMSGETIGQALDRTLMGGSGPRFITVDHGTEFQSRALEDCADQRSVQRDFIRPGKPMGNAFIESFNGRLRDECLNVHQFASLAEAIIEPWQFDYNQCRSHSSLSHLTPDGFVRQRQVIRAAEEAVCSS